MTNLKRIRQQRGLSQSELAESSGVSVRMIQHYEQRFRNINQASAETVTKLADALAVDVHDLLEEYQN